MQNRELAKGEQRFRSLIDMVPDIIYRLDKEGNILYLNKAISQLGYRQDELIGVHIEQLLEFDEAWRAETGDEADAARAGEREVRLLEKRRSEERIATIEPLGDEWLEWKDATGRRYRIPGSAAVRDVTSSKRMAHELQRTESSLAAAQRIAHLGEWHWDIASDSVNYSEELYNILGVEPGSIGGDIEGFMSLAHPHDLAAMDEALQLALSDPMGRYDHEYRIVRPDGEERVVHALGEVSFDEQLRPLHLIGTLHDVTERVRASEEIQRLNTTLEVRVRQRTDQLTRANESLKQTMQELKVAQRSMIQSEKMSALGTLTAGVAHEMNNPLMGIVNFVNYAQRNVTHEKSKHALERALEEINRLVDIVRGMRTFSHPPQEKLTAVDLPQVLQNALQLMATTLRHRKVEVLSEAEQALPEIAGKGDSLEQVFINLLMNAADAMEGREQKRIEVVMRRQGEREVRVEVRDNGEGMNEELLLRIFDPFYTTKEPGKGTGLGLYICRNIIDGLKGSLECASVEGEGTCFTIILPTFMPE
ncbi:MAG: hypothetical protein B0D96_07645 [Candidatus Sedimenticola endophacoides]|uniref:histidine kinase n=2 Tax=Candidatus Sedimenticola endophacoides TaxID=2548426 RepID=A0A6N4DPT0_9GAMM|nr:MAG: hypothetical protein B0D96_07645 [Candidatus Sedimenticola endophacoides]OQX40594.1 MAG: hypothetical protein B0D89_07150 [Candidatus Sedimenticola endophacoides]PUD99226.1 MAG: hypothetical protein C3L24_11315 [Candidatus Sedimenticola endophacoides]PUE02045.1 MAG: hypothetical protein C3L26_02035 [Candidatus Sedimenticola endophacoides]PUE05054.1 MAG: hypothetical protein C3L25_02030 [Candidatus Sedimenticola endophacoides]